VQERRIELIKELREVEGEEDEGRLTTPDRRNRVREAAVDSIAGEVTSGLLDFLSKDLVRKEEKVSERALKTSIRASERNEQYAKRAASEAKRSEAKRAASKAKRAASKAKRAASEQQAKRASRN